MCRPVNLVNPVSLATEMFSLVNLVNQVNLATETIRLVNQDRITLAAHNQAKKGRSL